MAAVLMFCAIFLFLPLAKQESVERELHKVLKAIKAVVDFYGSNYQDLNIDGLYGLRVLEGHLGDLVKKHENGELHHLDSGVVPELKAMKNKASNLSELAVVHVKRDSQSYYRQMSYVVKSPWDLFDGHHKRVNMSLAWPKEVYISAKKTVVIDEKMSDKCMSELIGSNKPHGTSCDISSKCVYTMTAPGLLGYAVTHQILWTMLAEKAGCTEKLQARLFELHRGNLQALREELCSNNYIQMKETLQKLPNKQILPSIQDLFLEQMFMCPSLGYFEFLDLTYLDQILSWQLKSGCYGKMKRSKVKGLKLDTAIFNPVDEDYTYEDTKDALKFDRNALKLEEDTKNVKPKNAVGVEKSLIKPEIKKELPIVDSAWQMARNKGRKLLVEKAMTGGCLAHKTAVASGALIMFLRYLCEPDAAELFATKPRLQSAYPPVGRGKHGDLVNKEILPGLKSDQGVKSDPRKMNKSELPNNGDPIETLHLNLKKEAEYPNSVEKLEKFKESFDKHKNVVDANRVDGPYPMPKPIHLDPETKINKNKGNPNSKNVDGGNYEYKYDDYNGVDKGANKNNKNDNDYDDEDEEDEEEYDDDNYPDYNKRDDGETDRNLNQYYDGNDKDVRPNKDDKNPNDNDDDYNADDGYDDGYDDNDQENVHPHIHARNIGVGRSQDYDKGYDDDDKRVKQVKDYDDDEDGDDYEYDDDNAEMEQRRRDEVKNELFLAKPDKKTDSHRPNMTEENISEQSMLTTTSFFIFAICAVMLLVLYRFLTRKRLRLKLGHKHFHV